MNKLFVLMGKSATGKDTIYKEILKQKAIFKEEWMNLHQEFLEMFHSYT